MTTKHTPGPWIAAELTRRPVGLHYHWRIQTGEDRDSSDLIAVVPAEYPGEDAGEEANARLIAAAPELYEALRTLYLETADYIKRNNLGDVHHNRSMQVASDALKKATGLPTTL